MYLGNLPSKDDRLTLIGMSHRLIFMVTGLRSFIPCLTKLKTTANCSSHLRRKVVGIIVLAGGLAFLFACQGVSTGNSSDALASRLASLSFGNVQVGNKQTLSETVTNTGSSSITVFQIGLTGATFNLSGPTTPLTLTAGQSTSFSVTFAPTAAGSANGNVIIASNASNSTFTVPLSGTGTTTTGQLDVTPSPLAIGNVGVGTSGTASGSLTARGTDVTITAASTNNAQF